MNGDIGTKMDDLNFKVVWKANLCEDKECIIFEYFVAEIERLTIINRNLKKQLNNIQQNKGHWERTAYFLLRFHYYYVVKLLFNFFVVFWILLYVDVKAKFNWNKNDSLTFSNKYALFFVIELGFPIWIRQIKTYDVFTPLQGKRRDFEILKHSYQSEKVSEFILNAIFNYVSWLCVMVAFKIRGLLQRGHWSGCIQHFKSLIRLTDDCFERIQIYTILLANENIILRRDFKNLVIYVIHSYKIVVLRH